MTRASMIVAAFAMSTCLACALFNKGGHSLIYSVDRIELHAHAGCVDALGTLVASEGFIRDYRKDDTNGDMWTRQHPAGGGTIITMQWDTADVAGLLTVNISDSSPVYGKKLREESVSVANAIRGVLASEPCANTVLD